jgi:hypothetical protein
MRNLRVQTGLNITACVMSVTGENNKIKLYKLTLHIVIISKDNLD